MGACFDAATFPFKHVGPAVKNANGCSKLLTVRSLLAKTNAEVYLRNGRHAIDFCILLRSWIACGRQFLYSSAVMDRM